MEDKAGGGYAGFCMDEARADYKLRCINCSAGMWATDVPDKNVCPFCGARGTLVEDR